MKTYTANAQVTPGLYLNRDEWSFRALSEPGQLPGVEGQRWLRVPVLALLVLGPLMGLAYVIFLPVLGFFMFGGTVIEALGKASARVANAGFRVLRPAWQPAQAFLSHSKQKKQAKAGADAWSDEARKELDKQDKPEARS